MDAANRAKGRAAFYLTGFALQILRPILVQRDAWMPALLRTPVDEPVLAHIEVATAGAAVPIVRTPVRQVLLKPVVGCDVERRTAERYELVQNRLLRVIQSAQFALIVVNDSGRRRKAKGARAPGNDHRIVGIADASTHDRIHGDVKLTEFGKPSQFLIEDLETLFRDFDGHDV